MKYFIIAGEASGDLHASNMMKGIRQYDAEAQFTGWGGDLMQAGGLHLLKHIRELAFMGFTEVVVNLRTILRNFDLVKLQIIEYQPDALLLVDYPGFNMRMAKWAKMQGIKVYYYISPNVWAWKSNRVFHFKKYCEKLFVILPFEQEFYSRYYIDVVYEGHPLIDAVESHRKITFNEFCAENSLDGRPVIALLAGSRKQEISRMLPIMLSVVDDFPQYQFVVAGSPGIDKDYYSQYLRQAGAVLVMNKTYDVLSHAEIGLIKSGTATLEAALLDVPQAVCYKAGLISVLIAAMVKKVKYISLVNLIMNKACVTELLQFRLNRSNLKKEIASLLPDTARRKQMLNDYADLRNRLGDPGSTVRVGAQIVKLMSDGSH